MRYEFKTSFDRSIRARPSEQKELLISACLALVDVLESHAPMPAGTGLKRLQDGFWEIRQGLHNRILFRWRGDLVEFVLAGDHDSIKDYLKDV